METVIGSKTGTLGAPLSSTNSHACAVHPCSGVFGQDAQYFNSLDDYILLCTLPVSAYQSEMTAQVKSDVL